MKLRSAAVALATGAAVLAVPLAASPAAAASACTAKVNNARPTQNAAVTVTVSKVGGGAAVTTSARYKSTTTKKSTTAAGNGAASVTYKIGRATKGFKVVVSVSASKGSARWSCSTSFTPR